MSKLDVVHGDLRSNNIMVEVSDSQGTLPEEPKLKLIDFDWGGTVAEEVRYPLLRNPELGDGGFH